MAVQGRVLNTYMTDVLAAYIHNTNCTELNSVPKNGTVQSNFLYCANHTNHSNPFQMLFKTIQAVEIQATFRHNGTKDVLHS